MTKTWSSEAQVIMEPECRNGLRQESTFFVGSGVGPGVGIMNRGGISGYRLTG